MRASRVGRVRFAAASTLAFVLAGVASCGDDPISGTGTEVQVPEMIGAVPLSQTAISIEWRTVPGVAGYLIERRQDLEGDFQPLTRIGVPRSATDSVTSFLDSGLEPETFYGYRVRALGELGGQSAYGIVVGGMTAPRPGINVDVATAGLPPEAFGYLLRVEGPEETQELPVGANAKFLLGPLAPGRYVLSLDELPQGCSVDGIPDKEVEVSGTGLDTQEDVQFRVSCVDPNLGNVVVKVLTVGDTLPLQPYRIDLTGILGGEAVTDTLPVPARLSPGSTVSFRNLQPGDYEAELDRVTAPCQVQGDNRVSGILVQPLQTDTVSFSVACRKPVNLEGVIIRGTWRDTGGNQVTTVVPGAPVRLELTADVADTLDLSAFQATLSWDASLLEVTGADDVDVGPSDNLDQFTSNLGNNDPGNLNFQTFSLTGVANSGLQGIAAIDFDAVAAGTVLLTLDVTTAANFQSEELVRSVSIPDLRIDQSGGTLPPRADPGGPYSGDVAQVLSFDGSGSSDPDGGSILKYVWDFGDGVRDSVSGPTPTHAYGAEGSYTVTLTVEDDEGERGDGTTTATVAAPTTSATLIARWTDASGSPLTGAARVGDDVGLLLCASGPGLATVSGSLRYESDLIRLDSGAELDSGGSAVPACSGTSDEFGRFSWDGPGLNPVSWENGIPDGGSAGVGPQGIARFTFRVLAVGEGEAGVNLTVEGTDTDGRALEFSRDIPSLEIEASAGATADAGGPYRTRVGEPVVFDASGSAPTPGASVTGYEWDFGDGSGETTTGPTVSHTYAEVGTYALALTVRDSDGGSATDQTTVTVTADTGGEALGWSNRFEPPSVAPGASVVLIASTRPDIPFRGVRARVAYDATVLRLDSVAVSPEFSFPAPIIDTSEVGVVEAGGSSRTTLDGSTEREVARMYFTVVGGVGAAMTTSTVLTLIQNENAIPVLDLSPYGVEESSVEVGGGG